MPRPSIIGGKNVKSFEVEKKIFQNWIGERDIERISSYRLQGPIWREAKMNLIKRRDTEEADVCDFMGSSG